MTGCSRHRASNACLDAPPQTAFRSYFAESMTAVIETKDLCRQYGRRWALRECNAVVPAGKVVGLVGPNCFDRPRARFRSSAGIRPADLRNWLESALSLKTHRHTADSPSTIT